MERSSGHPDGTDIELKARRLASALFGNDKATCPNELLASLAIFDLFERVEIGIVAIDIDNRVVYRNPQYAEIFSVLGIYLDGSDDFVAAIEAWAAAEGTESPELAALVEAIEYRRPVSCGVHSRDHYFRVQALPLPEGGVVLIYTDVTDAELLKRRSEREARLLSTLIDAVPCFISYIDTDRRFVFANEMYAEQFGRSLGDIIGRTYSDILGPELISERAPLLDRCLAGETVVFSGAGPRRCSAMQDVHGVYAPVLDADGVVHGAAIVTVDDTERRAIERELESKNRELAVANARLKRLAMTDGLTGILNRAAILSALDDEVRKAARYGHDLAVAFFDIDHFKLVNDTYGHAAGDVVIRRFTAACAKSFRETDYFGRYGGEEFLAILPEGGVAGASDAAERARAAMEAERFADTKRAPDVAGYGVTVSVGVARWRPGLDSDGLIAIADAALYQAKDRGRNIVVVAEDAWS